MTTQLPGDMSDLREGMREMVTAMRGVKTELVRLTQENNALKDELDTLKDSIGSTPASVAPSDAEYGPFSHNLNPARRKHMEYTTDNRKGRTQPRKIQFNWEYFDRLYTLLDRSPDYADSQECDKELITILSKAAAADTRAHFSIVDSVIWGDVSPDMRLYAITKLEELAAPHVPLRYCQGHQGAILLLEHFWSSSKRGAKRTNTEGNSIHVFSMFL
jgi:regulator of replication initiation timing